MIFVYIILCHVKRLCYIPALVYITLCYTMCICMPAPIPLWYMIMYITSHTILIYYNNYYYDNYNSYLFFIFIIVLLYVCACVCVCIVLCCLSCVCMCALLCVLAYAHTCVSVCVYSRLTLPDHAVVKRLMCWYRGVYFGKKFLQNLENGYTR